MTDHEPPESSTRAWDEREPSAPPEGLTLPLTPPVTVPGSRGAATGPEGEPEETMPNGA